MSNTDSSLNKLGYYAGWTGGVFLLVGGIGNFTETPFSSILLITSSLFLIPKSRQFIFDLKVVKPITEKLMATRAKRIWFYILIVFLPLWFFGTQVEKSDNKTENASHYTSPAPKHISKEEMAIAAAKSTFESQFVTPSSIKYIGRPAVKYANDNPSGKIRGVCFSYSADEQSQDVQQDYCQVDPDANFANTDKSWCMRSQIEKSAAENGSSPEAKRITLNAIIAGSCGESAK